MLQLLGKHSESNEIKQFLTEFNTLDRPSLDDEDKSQHYDWVLVRRKGVEFGFVDKNYFEGTAERFWRDEGLVFNQISFYNDTRDGVSPYQGQLPYDLVLTDTRDVVRKKMAAHDSTRCSYITDRWTIENHRLIIAYKPNDAGIDNVHIKLSISPLAETSREQPNIAAKNWFTLFGMSVNHEGFVNAITPFNAATRMKDEDDQREVDYLHECGLTLYFEERQKLKLPKAESNSPVANDLVFAAVKFFRARDLDARQYTGELPFSLSFDQSPESLLEAIAHKPAKHNDGPTTGRILWHLDHCSLQVLYSTIENHIFRVMLMAPGYWSELGESDELVKHDYV